MAKARPGQIKLLCGAQELGDTFADYRCRLPLWYLLAAAEPPAAEVGAQSMPLGSLQVSVLSLKTHTCTECVETLLWILAQSHSYLDLYSALPDAS